MVERNLLSGFEFERPSKCQTQVADYEVYSVSMCMHMCVNVCIHVLQILPGARFLC